MHRSIVMMMLALAALWSQPSLAQSPSQLGPLCTSDTTPAEAQIDACNEIIALKVFSAGCVDGAVGRDDQEHAGAVVELVAARRGLSRGQVN
jgi:hypothetical protein